MTDFNKNDLIKFYEKKQKATMLAYQADMKRDKESFVSKSGYLSLDKIFIVLNPILTDVKLAFEIVNCVLLPYDNSIYLDGKAKTEIQVQKYKVDYILIDLETGFVKEYKEIVPSETTLKPIQSYGSTKTYMTRYILGQLFQIVTEIDPDQKKEISKQIKNKENGNDVVIADFKTRTAKLKTLKEANSMLLEVTVNKSISGTLWSILQNKTNDLSYNYNTEKNIFEKIKTKDV